LEKASHQFSRETLLFVSALWMYTHIITFLLLFLLLSDYERRVPSRARLGR
jgi:hypothetical protein